MGSSTAELKRLAGRGTHAEPVVVVATALRRASILRRPSPTQRTVVAPARWVVATCLVAAAGMTVRGSDLTAPRRGANRAPIVFNDNGAWSWFEDERAIVDTASGTLLVGSVASRDGTGGAARDGDVEVVAVDVATRDSRRTVLHDALEADDHNSPGLFVRSDGRYLASYSRHGTDDFTRWQVSAGAGITSDWGGERRLELPAGTTYANLYATPSARDRLYNFVRTVDRDPHFLVSEDHGSTWRRGGRLLAAPGRPYVRYASDGRRRIHLITTEEHPHEYGTSIYHGVIAGNRLLSSDGVTVDADLSDDDAVAPNRLTTIFRGDDERRAWTTDIHIDANGHPYAAFSVTSSKGTENWYYYARLDGSRWHVHRLAHAGTGLYESQPEYMGLVALDPHHPSRLVISTDADPITGSPLIGGDGERHHELFEGTTDDGGVTWSWEAITSGSTVDNIRPIIPIWDSAHNALLWLRGTYTHYQRYDLEVVGIVEQ